jgi:hypothetical protein
MGGVRVVGGVRLAASAQAVKAAYTYMSVFSSASCGDPEDARFGPESGPSPDLESKLYGKLWEQSKCLIWTS